MVVVVGRGEGVRGGASRLGGAGGGVVGRAAAFWGFQGKKRIWRLFKAMGSSLLPVYCRRNTSFLFLFC